MAYIRSAISLAILAALAPWLYDRYLGFSTMLANRPGNLHHINEFKSLEIACAECVRNCEDVVLDEDLGVAILSCDPGRDRWNTVMGTFHPPSTTHPTTNNGALHIFTYATTQTTTPISLLNFPASTHDFHPLGIAHDPSTHTLHVINHSRLSGPVLETFHLSLQNATATHIRTISHPLLHAPNAIQLLGNGKMYVTNDHYIHAAVSRLVSKVETFSGVPGGSVVYLDTQDLGASKVVARVPFANGIARLNKSTIAVASSSRPGVYFFDIAGNGRDLVYKKYIRTPAGADNLSVDGNGKLMIAGHPYAPSLMQVAEGRKECDGERREGACGCWAPSWVGEWNEEGGLRTLLMDERKVCSSSTAVRDVGRGVGIVSQLYGRGVGVWRE